MQEKKILLGMVIEKQVCFGEITMETFSEKSHKRQAQKMGWPNRFWYTIERLTQGLILRPSLS